MDIDLRKGGSFMFHTQEIKRLVPLLLFWGSYTLLFLLWAKTFFYTLPFLLGFLLSIAVQPAVAFLNKKLGWNRSLSAALVTVVSLAALLAALTFLSIFAVQEIAAFILRVSDNGFAEFSKPVADFLNRVGSWLQNFDLDFLGRNKQEIMDILKNSTELIAGFLKAVLSVITSLPTVITMAIVVAFSTFFISRDMGKLRGFLRNILSDSAAFHVKSVAENSGGMGRKYLLSYLFLYFITFCETFVIMSILSVPYPLTIALITAAADVLPVLGPGFVFLPLAVYQLLIGQYTAALGMVIGWGIISLIRQIVEPKLISSTVKVHPLAMLAAIYFSLVGKSLWILLYVAGFFALYSAFRETGALPGLTDFGKKAEKAKEINENSP